MGIFLTNQYSSNSSGLAIQKIIASILIWFEKWVLVIFVIIKKNNVILKFTF